MSNLTKEEKFQMEKQYDDAAIQIVAGNIDAIKRDAKGAVDSALYDHYDNSKEYLGHIEEWCKNIESMFKDYINATRKRDL